MYFPPIGADAPEISGDRHCGKNFMERSISRPDNENTLTFPLFRYYHIKVKAMNVHSKILFS